MLPTRREAIQRFLLAKAPADLAALYTPSMEMQCNVGQDGGTRVDAEFRGHKWQAWTDGLQTWKSFRVPHNAATNATYEDVNLTFDLEAHVEAIGMTGWDWENKLSRWVAFDFDAISGHSTQHQKKLSPEELEKVQNAAIAIPWVTVRKSTGGKGLHLYVHLIPVPTENHTEHAALGRAILGRLSALAGFDFDAKVDTCGGNMWVWHRKLASSPEGLQLIKQGTLLAEPPINWRDHIDVVAGKRRKVRAAESLDSSWKEDDTRTEAERIFDELTGQRPKTPLDEAHKRLLTYLLEENVTGSWWDADHWMLVTHTFWLKKAHTDLGLKGIFDTLATGQEKENDHNCFMFPSRRGSWTVRRYSSGVAESPSWRQDSSGYTYCNYNHDPDLHTAARAYGGIETDKGYTFREFELAQKVAIDLGANIKVPPWVQPRATRLRPFKDGRLMIEVERKADDGNLEGWSPEKDKWKRIFDIRVTQPIESEIGNYDDLIRHVVTSTGDDYGWMIRDEGNMWRTEPLVHLKAVLKSQGMNQKDAEVLIGQSVTRPWKLVNMPFKEEYPGNRQWNREAAQFRFVPSLNKDSLNYPTWSKVLSHCGAGLDSAVANDGWCKVNGIINGADYLKLWIASIFQYPMEPLPYLFFYGPQNSGKSTFHEALALLMTKGYARAERALMNESGFNAELEGAICCVVEEINLGDRKGNKNDANNRIKDWVTAIHLPIHRKTKTPYHIPNSTHWVQTSNDENACPIFPGDTRITMILVGELDPIDLLPKRKLIDYLEREAPDFLAAVMSLEIPPPSTRMNIPVIATEEKAAMQRTNRTPIQIFLDEQCHYVPGEMIEYKTLYEKFVEVLEPNEVPLWTQRRFGSQLPPQFPKGRNPKDGKWNIGNVSFAAKPASGPKLIMKTQGANVMLVPEDYDNHKANP